MVNWIRLPIVQPLTSMDNTENINNNPNTPKTPDQSESRDRPALNTFQQVLVILLIVAVAVVLYWPTYVWRVNQKIMERTKSTLRDLGMAELSYQAWNNQKTYANFSLLQQEGNIPKDTDPEIMIPEYYLEFDINNENPPYDPRSCLERPVFNYFTIYAFPDRPHNLNTFCITDDQVLRVYNPSHGNKYDYIYHWDPVL